MLSPRPVAILWEVAQLLGALALIATLLLCIWVLRPRRGSTRPLTLNRHELLGWSACAAALGHAALLLLIDRRVIQDFRLSGPRYEWCGLAALVLLLALTVPALSALRRRLWRQHRTFQAQHVILAAALVLLASAHVLATGRYVHGHLAAGAAVGLAAAVLLSLLRPRPSVEPARSVHAPRLVFGRYSRVVGMALTATALALALGLLPQAGLALRGPLAGHGPPLGVDFPHAVHREVACVRCHHNFVDHTGEGSCYDCHRSARMDLRVAAEARFHDFCLGCHRDPPPGAQHHGPTTGCATCHP